ncbi:hypothetical protein A2U01_0066217, partial [Trifolium medium]|nr:hypothetical protein [Trifolium medium]
SIASKGTFNWYLTTDPSH